VSKAVISAAGMQAGRQPQASACSANPVAAASTSHGAAAAVAKRGASAAALPVGVATPDMLAAMTRGASASLPPMVADEAPPQKRTPTNAPAEVAPVEAAPVLAPASATDLSAEALVHYDSGLGAFTPQVPNFFFCFVRHASPSPAASCKKRLARLKAHLQSSTHMPPVSRHTQA
jgi:hypothetical protein